MVKITKGNLPKWMRLRTEINWHIIDGCSYGRDGYVEATVKYLFLCFFLGPEAVLPADEAALENQDVPEDLQEVVLFAPDKECQKQDKTVLPIVETPKKQVKRKITHEDVLEQQYKALIAKQENLQLKKRKLELEVFLLEQKVCSIPAQVSINLSP